MTVILRATRLALKAVPGLVAVIMVALAVVVVSGQVRLEPVLTGSMTPRFPVGTLVAVTPISGHALHLGDVVMFVPPKPYGTPTGGPIMHRLVSVTRGPDGHLQFRTKGDANTAKDPWVLNGDGGGFARLRASSVVAGKVLTLVRHSTSGPALLFWPGLLLLLVALHRARTSGPQGKQRTPARPAATDNRRYQPRHAAA